jgi:hypothetical protein
MMRPFFCFTLIACQYLHARQVNLVMRIESSGAPYYLEDKKNGNGLQQASSYETS